MHPIYDDDRKWSALSLYQEEHPENFIDYHHSHVLLGFNQRTYKFLYCVHRADYEKPSWTWILTPFEPAVWLFLSLTIISISLVKRRISMSSDVMQFLLYKPVQNMRNNWSFPLFSSLSMIIFLSYHYEGMVTTNLTAPLGLASYNSMKQAHEAGFRKVMPDRKYFIKYKKIVGHDFEKQVGRPLKETDIVFEPTIDQVVDRYKLTWQNRMAEIKGMIHMYEVLTKKLGGNRIAVRNDKVICFLIRDPVYTITFKIHAYFGMMASPFLRKGIFKLLNGQAGLYLMFQERYWGNHARKIIKYRIKENLCSEPECNHDKVEGIFASFGVLFIYLLCGLVVTIVVFFMETRICKVKKPKRKVKKRAHTCISRV